MATKFVSADELMKAVEIVPEPFAVPGLGTVEVRSLTMDEIDHIRTTYKDSTIQQVIHAVATGMTNPKLDEAQVAALHQGKPKVIAAISNKVFALSGQGEDA